MGVWDSLGMLILNIMINTMFFFVVYPIFRQTLSFDAAQRVLSCTFFKLLIMVLQKLMIQPPQRKL